jgi:hypothetical protein
MKTRRPVNLLQSFRPDVLEMTSVRRPDFAHATMASAMRLRTSWLSFSGGILLQTASSAAVMLAIVV